MSRHEKFDGEGKARVARHRAAMRGQGYRLKQIWVPDTSTRQFLDQARHDCGVINAQADQDDLAFAETLQHWPPNDPN